MSEAVFSEDPAFGALTNKKKLWKVSLKRFKKFLEKNQHDFLIPPVKSTTVGNKKAITVASSFEK